MFRTKVLSDYLELQGKPSRNGHSTPPPSDSMAGAGARPPASPTRRQRALGGPVSAAHLASPLKHGTDKNKTERPPVWPAPKASEVLALLSLVPNELHSALATDHARPLSPKPERTVNAKGSTTATGKLRKPQVKKRAVEEEDEDDAVQPEAFANAWETLDRAARGQVLVKEALLTALAEWSISRGVEGREWWESVRVEAGERMKAVADEVARARSRLES